MQQQQIVGIKPIEDYEGTKIAVAHKSDYSPYSTPPKHAHSPGRFNSMKAALPPLCLFSYNNYRI